MKKITLIVGFVSISSILLAQNAVGLKAGLNFSEITNYDASMKVGFHVGGLAHLHITPAFSLQPEFMFSSQGSKQQNNVPGVNLNYINIPVLLQYNFDNGFRVQGGPQIGFRLSAKDFLFDSESDISDRTQSIDFSIPLGLSYLGNSGLGFDARYNIGVTNVFTNPAENYRNSVMQVGIFYLLNHKHKQASK